MIQAKYSVSEGKSREDGLKGGGAKMAWFKKWMNKKALPRSSTEQIRIILKSASYKAILPQHKNKKNEVGNDKCYLLTTEISHAHNLRLIRRQVIRGEPTNIICSCCCPEQMGVWTCLLKFLQRDINLVTHSYLHINSSVCTHSMSVCGLCV